MLQIKKISKKYQTGDLIQTALDSVSLNLRDNEFVAILGPSGSGKTTLLNVIGGLDRYDSGDLIINSISTKKYKDRDWDSYRNHTIGFVFQSYNLIPHQSILANVELALTISGISRSERKKRAREALEKVGLGDQLHKKPNQMSGGQMQRVAIARALVNNPEVLLADEPTGALDTETSMQVMELLKEVAKDRLVVMVTHNPELADKYATRTVKLRDGRVIDDSNPFELGGDTMEEPIHKTMGKSSMSLMTSLSLSFNNLRTKKGRTLLTSFAGSIGIIGIALILSLSTGVNAYIDDIQKSTMTSYPVSIEERSVDFSSLMAAGEENSEEKELDHERNDVYLNGRDFEIVSSMTTSIKENNLTEFKKYLDKDNSEIHQYIGENGIVYSYDIKFNVFTHDSEKVLVNTDGSTLPDSKFSSGGGMGGMDGMGGMFEGRSNNFEQLMPGTGDALISSAVTDSYDILYGKWPSAYNEVILTLDKNNEISAVTLFELGILPATEYKELMDKIEDGEEITIEEQKWSYADICNQKLYMIPSSGMYNKNENGLFESVGDDNTQIEKLLEKAVELIITGVIRPKKDADYVSVRETLGYTKALTDYIIDYTNNSEAVKAQEASRDTNIFSGVSFAPSDDAAKIADAKVYITNMGVTQKANLGKSLLSSMNAGNPSMAGQMAEMGETELAAMFDSYLENPEEGVLLSIYDKYISAGSYDENMETLGVVSLDAPSSINIYADNFEDKDDISACIENYNKTASEVNQISYTDYVALLMSSVTTIVNVISYVLIAFVAVSLVVSSIMIGIITYISVLERTKEIGILRAIGASKKNISQVFNAETFIIGFCSGSIGVGISALLLIPGNAVIHALTDSANVNAQLPIISAVVLVALSMVLTLIGGLIPAKKAAKKDPVIALRTE
ncbi:MAG: ABC transporter ATP-binding protein/permease [Oscillospiraceae bacterium]|nr:ABC transporter ATP-binding protein/permease [Oscillospiraceae bacterium]